MKIFNRYVMDFMFFIAVHKDCIIVGCVCRNVTYMKVFVKCLIIAAPEAEIICFEAENSSFGTFYRNTVDDNIAYISAPVSVRLEVNGIFTVPISMLFI